MSMDTEYYRCAACGKIGRYKLMHWSDMCDGKGACATAAHLPVGHGSESLRVLTLKSLSGLFVEKGSLPGPYYMLFLPEDYYEGEQRKVTFAVRKKIKTFVAGRLKDGEFYGEYDLQGNIWRLHLEILEHIEPMLSRPLADLIRDAEEDEEEWQRIHREAEAKWNSFFGFNSFSRAPHHAELFNARRLFGLTETATREEIKGRYRALAKQHHPDTGGDPEQFKKVSQAYNVLLEHLKMPVHI